jgi:predicted phage-related endonuclease
MESFIAGIHQRLVCLAESHQADCLTKGIFEHKTLNASIKASMIPPVELEDQYCIQMEHQLLVSGASRCLFMASAFDDNDQLLEENNCWYEPNLELRARIVAGWEQFAIDLEEYKRKLAAGEIVQPKETPKAEAIKALPSVFVQATGMVTASNLAEFKEAATTFIAAIKTELVCDQDFSDAEATVKFCKEAESNLEATKASVLAQMSTVDEVVRTLDYIKKQLADKRLMLDKLVKSEKESRKEAIVMNARADFNEHFTALESEIKPIRIIAQYPDFPGAMKGLKKLSAMQEAADTALRDGIFTIDAIAKDVRAKLGWCKEHAAGRSALFPDLQSLMAKPMEDFTLTITSRIEKQKADEAARLEAQRAAIQAEEEAKARAKMEAEARATVEAEQRTKAEDQAKIDTAAEFRRQQAEFERANAEEHAKVEAELAEQKAIDEASQRQHEKSLHGEPDVIQAANVEAIDTSKKRVDIQQENKQVERPTRPSDKELIEFVAHNFNVSFGTACDWVIETAERLKVAA